MIALFILAAALAQEDAASDPEPTVPELIRAAEAPETDLLARQKAVSRLADLQDRSAIPTLLKLLRPEGCPRNGPADLTFRAYVAERLAEWTHQCLPVFLYDPAIDPIEAKKVEESTIAAWAAWWLAARDQTDAQWIESGVSRAIDLLRSPDPDVRAIAIAHLKEQTDLDFEYDPQGEESAREAAVGRWTRWWAENRSRIRWDPDKRRLVTGE